MHSSELIVACLIGGPMALVGYLAWLTLEDFRRKRRVASRRGIHALIQNVIATGPKSAAKFKSGTAPRPVPGPVSALGSGSAGRWAIPGTRQTASPWN